MKDYNSILPVFERGKDIPELIHQTYKSKNIEDAELRANVEYLQTINEQWKYNLYDDADIEQFI